MQKLIGVARKGFGVVLVLACMAIPAFAAGAPGPDPAPEIDPGSIASAIAVLAGGICMLADRRRAK